MTGKIKPSPEVNEALRDLIKAAGKFAFATSMQYKEINPKDYKSMVEAFNKGLADAVVVISLSPDKCAQLCMDVGTERRVIATVPATNITLN